MTTPSSPPISMKDVATELGVSSVGLSLSASNVRTLAGVASGPISLHNLLGKSAYTPMSPNIGPDQNVEDGATRHDFFATATPNGGVGPYTYQWFMPSQGGSAGGTASFVGSTTAATVEVEIAVANPFDTYGCGIYCAVTDSTSRTVNSNEANLGYTSP